ncbi:MAG TPA: pyridoxal-phosphate dependent enzyme [Phycisphaerae bacterium]
MLGARLPRIPIGTWPTPIQRLNNFEHELPVASLWVKREDLSDPQCGGNKLRGLEFLLADAERHRARALLTFGAAGSYHVRATVLAGRRLGFDVSALLLPQPNAEYVRRNIVIARAAGARLVPVRAPLLPLAIAREWLHARPYIIPPGGTSPLSSIGQVNAAFELRDAVRSGTLPEPDYLFVALGSLGTAAGLALGCKLSGLKTRVVGVTVFARWYCTPARIARHTGRIARLMRALDPNVPKVRLVPEDVVVLGQHLGRGYAQFTQDGLEAARQLRETEALMLDGTYTAKAYSGALEYLRAHGQQNPHGLIWHTYLHLPAPPWSAADVERLPRALQAYFRQPLQPLDIEP